MEGQGDEVANAPESIDKDGNIVELPAMEISTTTWPENSHEVSTDNSEDKCVKKCLTCLAGPTFPCTCSSSTNDASFVVEKLTLKNYDKSKLSTTHSFNRAEEMESRKGQWGNLYNMAGGSGNGNLNGGTLSKQFVTTGGGEDASNTLLPEFRAQKLPLSGQPNQSSVSELLINRDKNILSETGLPPRQTPAKPLTSGFSKFFVKNVLMEKGAASRNPEGSNKFGLTVMEQNDCKETCVANASVNCSPEINHLSLNNAHGASPITQIAFHEGINLREWLKPGFRKVDKAESLHIFMQIVKLVNVAHSQQVALQDVSPSCFELLPSNRVKYVGSLASRELVGSTMGLSTPCMEHHLSRKRSLEQGTNAYNSVFSKHQKLDENIKFALDHTQSLATSGLKSKTVEAVDIIERQDSGYSLSNECDTNTKHLVQNRSQIQSAHNTARQKSTSIDFQLEDKWYTSPEELNDSGSTFSSNIYCLGVLLFELLCCFESLEVHAAAMSDLRHRILPPNFLSENPIETGFCLRLLHPEPSSRPRTREILQSKIICGSQEPSSMDQLSAPADEESELLLYFLAILKDEKQKKSSRLVEDIRCLEADLEEVSKMHLSRTGEILGRSHKELSASKELEFVLKEPQNSEFLRSGSLLNNNGSRLTMNISQLESAYFLARSQMQLRDTNTMFRSDKDLIRNRDRWSSAQNENEEVFLNQQPTDPRGAFFDGLCKYARHSKLEQRAVLRNGDLFGSANVICSLSFDRDEDYFATAGVSKKIKIFEFHALLNDSVDIHYPVVEMKAKSRLSCVCWNNYIKNYLASTDYDGDVQLWDASTGQVFSQYMEHEKRAWSADFSQVDPKKLASGSDDGTVKLWSIDEQKSISTIRNIANICCVQFSVHSTNLLAFGSADYKTYCYDLRNTRIPWCTLAGHGKAVSYVKFLDSETLVSASTDNTLKLWDLNKTSSSGLSTSACSLTFSGHTNEKNFVGLSVSDGYIACGSETNEVYAYHRSLPIPITSSKFGSIDPISGRKTGNDNGQFVSSVCWRGESNMILTASSTGSIKLLELV